MARPRKYQEHKLEAYAFFQHHKADHGGDPAKVLATDVQVDLETEHPNGTASYRLIADWVKEFKGQDEWQALLDSPFEWHRLREYELPWDASEFLLQMWAYYRELTRDLEWALKYSGPQPVPTVRQAHWWWRVHQAAPAQDNGFVYIWSDQLWKCELSRDVLGKHVDISGIDAYLAYRPWMSEKNQIDYDQAESDGRIPSLPSNNEDSELLKELRGRPELSKYFPQANVNSMRDLAEGISNPQEEPN